MGQNVRKGEEPPGSMIIQRKFYVYIYNYTYNDIYIYVCLYKSRIPVLQHPHEGMDWAVIVNVGHGMHIPPLRSGWFDQERCGKASGKALVNCCDK